MFSTSPSDLWQGGSERPIASEIGNRSSLSECRKEFQAHRNAADDGPRPPAFDVAQCHAALTSFDGGRQSQEEGPWPVAHHKDARVLAELIVEFF